MRFTSLHTYAYTHTGTYVICHVILLWRRPIVSLWHTCMCVGRYSFDVCSWRNKESSVINQMRRYFIGDDPVIKDITYLSSPDSLEVKLQRITRDCVFI